MVKLAWKPLVQEKELVCISVFTNQSDVSAKFSFVEKARNEESGGASGWPAAGGDIIMFHSFSLLSSVILFTECISFLNRTSTKIFLAWHTQAWRTHARTNTHVGVTHSHGTHVSVTHTHGTHVSVTQACGCDTHDWLQEGRSPAGNASTILLRCTFVVFYMSQSLVRSLYSPHPNLFY